MYIDTLPVSFGVKLVPQYDSCLTGNVFRELSHYFFDEFDLEQCLEVCGALENAARILRSADLHGNIPEVKVHTGQQMIWFDGELAGKTLPYMYAVTEQAEKYRDIYLEMARLIAYKIGAQLPQIPWLIAEAA